RSTGPKTAEGKDASRRNALKHGLAGSGAVLPEDDLALVEERTAAFRADLRPADAHEEALVEQMALDSVRLERCRKHFVVLCHDYAVRAQLCWDDGRRLEAEHLAARSAKDPARVSRQLRRTRQGCELLIERWEGLGRVLREAGEWTDAQRALALD